VKLADLSGYQKLFKWYVADGEDNWVAAFDEVFVTLTFHEREELMTFFCNSTDEIFNCSDYEETGSPDFWRDFMINYSSDNHKLLKATN
jgi:hypothetical protein